VDPSLTHRQAREVLDRTVRLRRQLDGIKSDFQDAPTSRYQTALTIAAVHERWGQRLDALARHKMRAAQAAERSGDLDAATQYRRMATTDLRIAAAQFESAAWNLARCR
jgi:hypothetical protein